MKKLLTIALLLIGFNSFSQNESNTIGWASFYNGASTDFSQEFQGEMANQLMNKFNTMVEIDSFAQNNGFMLHVGMVDLKATYKNGYAFSLVEIIAPNSYSKTLTAYWKADNNLTIVKSDSVDSTNVEFGWCSDFEKEFFRGFARENVIKEINGVELGFNYVADFQLFPDLTISIECISESKSGQLREIKELIVSSFSEVYISEVIENNGKLSVMIDFEGTELEEGLKQIEQFILLLHSQEIGGIIETIIVE